MVEVAGPIVNAIEDAKMFRVWRRDHREYVIQILG
jgi:hypothetical protein